MRTLMHVSAVLALTVTACDKKEEITEPGPELRRFENCSETQDYLAEVMLNAALQYQYSYYWGWGVDDVSIEAGSDESGSNSGPSDYSTTNVQEEGVDEIDLVKSDGQYIYVAQDKGVHIVDSWPVEESHKLATINLEGWARGLFLKEDKLVVFEHIYNNGIDGFNSYGNIRINVIDISDRSNPAILKQIDIDGYLADGRMIGEDVYAVVNHWSSLPQELWELVYNSSIELPEVNWNLSDEELEADIAQKRAEATEMLREPIQELAQNVDIDEILPKWRLGSEQEVESIHSCENLYRPSQVSQFNVLSLVHLDLEEDTANAQGLLSEGWTIYASQENLYVAQSGQWWWWGFGDTDMNSHIHKFSLNAGEEPSYSASGSVPGWLYDQFAMSEYEGHLRVASTDFDWWSGSSDNDNDAGNNITILRDDAKGTLRETGSIHGIAPGERIFASRMMGHRGYMVTFRQVDPLYTLDLSDPTDPHVVGELKIPGYSAYLHPINENYLLAVGMDGEDDGTLNGLAINLFDVSDFSDPKLKYQHTLNSEGWSWSESLWDHHAFTFHRDVLSIPAYSWNYDNEEGYEYFSGIMSFAIDAESGIEEIGRVDHSSLISGSECLYENWYGEYYEGCDAWYYRPYVRRSLYIEDNVFSLSNYGLKVTDLIMPDDEIAEVLFYPVSE